LERSLFLSFLVIALFSDVWYIALLDSDKHIFHFILTHFVQGGFLLPLTFVFMTLKKSESSVKFVASCSLFI